MQGGDSLLSPPNLPTEYVQLQKKLDAILAAGAEYTLAETGTEKQSVQMIDIDADGQNEVIAFFQMEQGQIRAYLFEYGQDGYYEVGFMEGNARRLYSVSYPVCHQSGRRAIALSWTSDETANRILSVSGYDGQQLYTMLQTQYTGLLYGDTDARGVSKIFLTTVNDVTGAHRARVFGIEGDKYDLIGETGMCAEVRSVLSLTLGRSSDGEKLLFADSAAHGGGYVTDVIAWDSEHRNLSMDSISGSGSSTWRQAAVLSADINGDGITEVPAVEQGMSGNIGWYTYGEGSRSQVAETYYSIADQWYILWPKSWGSNVLSQRTESDDVIMTTFYVPVMAGTMGEVRNALLTVYVFVGDDSTENLQSYSGVRVLGTAGSTVYGYSIMPNDFPEYSLTDRDVSDMFSIIQTSYFGEGNRND